MFDMFSKYQYIKKYTLGKAADKSTFIRETCTGSVQFTTTIRTEILVIEWNDYGH